MDKKFNLQIVYLYFIIACISQFVLYLGSLSLFVWNFILDILHVFLRGKERKTRSRINAPIFTEEDDGSVFSMRDGFKTLYAPGDLIRPLGTAEYLFAFSGICNNNNNTLQAITLTSKTPLNEEIVRKALIFLTKEFSFLQFSIQRRFFVQLWFKRIDRFKVDFKECHNQDPMQVCKDLICMKYDMWNGPLWRSRLVTSNVRSEGPRPYESVLIFCASHAITDAVANSALCRESVRMMNLLLKGQTVTAVPNKISPPIDDIVRKDVYLWEILKFLIYELYTCTFKSFNSTCYFNDTIEQPVSKNGGTKWTTQTLNEIETATLLQKCKIEGVTVHCCITTLANFSLFKLVKLLSNKPIDHVYLKPSHCVDLRRYCRESDKVDGGCQISVFHTPVTVTAKDLNQFWTATKCFNDEFKLKLSKGDPIIASRLMKFVCINYCLNDICVVNELRHMSHMHYITSNMGDMSHFMPQSDEDDDINIDDVFRTVTNDQGGALFLLNFHTFKGRLKISMDYYDSKLTDSQSMMYFDILFNEIKNICNGGDVGS